MRRLVLDIDDKYASIITITVVGNDSTALRVSTRAADLEKVCHLVVDENGRWEEEPHES